MNSHFNYNINPKKPNNSTHLGSVLNNAIFHHYDKKIRFRDIEINRIFLLINHLEVIKKHDSNLHQILIKELRKHENNDTFWGIRFEVRVTAMLIEKNISFQKQESPDFRLEDGIYIECSSVRLRVQNNKTDFNYKIGSLITKKLKSGYCTSSLAIYIDITNLLHTLSTRKLQFDNKEIKTFIKNRIEKESIGSILLFADIHPQGDYAVKNIYIRIDNATIDTKLKSFLDKYYPIEHDFENNFGLPYEG